MSCSVYTLRTLSSIVTRLQHFIYIYIYIYVYVSTSLYLDVDVDREIMTIL